MVPFKKYLIRTAVVVLAGSWFVAFSACEGKKEAKREAQGRPYEVIVVTSQGRWNGKLGDTLRAVLTEPVNMINRTEPLYDLYAIAPSGFGGVTERHRNLIMIDIGPEYGQPSIGVQYDVLAAPQTMLNITAPTDSALIAYISEHRTELQKIFQITERDRFLKYLSQYSEKNINQEIEKKFGFTMRVPIGFTIRNNDIDHFMWISHEYPKASLGIVIYSYPYTDKSDFEMESLIRRRNEFVRLIPGPSEGSFMSTSDAIFPELSHMRIYGRYWSELMGFWNVAHDFMGGPFRSYSTLDTENKRVVCLDMYVYSPQVSQRNFIRQLETLIYTVRFPGDQRPANE